MIEEELKRIDDISKLGISLMCIKNCDQIEVKYNSYRKYLEHINDAPKFYFEENKIYRVSNIINEYIYIDSYPFSVIPKENNLYIFDHFRELKENEINDITRNKDTMIENMVNSIINVFVQPNKPLDFINFTITSINGDNITQQKEYNLDEILDKINNNGVESLTKDEYEFLKNQSK